MRRSDSSGDRGDGADEAGTARWRIAAFAIIGFTTVGLLMASLVDAPLVSVLLVGLVLLCPLFLWVPFRLERATRQQPPSDRGDTTRSPV